MTTPEFLRLLENVLDQFDWTLTADLGHDPERRKKTRFQIRGVPLTEPYLPLGPVDALYYARFGEIPDNWTDAAARLGMGMEDAFDIAAASNEGDWSETSGHREPPQHLAGLRRTILEAVGLIPMPRD